MKNERSLYGVASLLFGVSALVCVTHHDAGNGAVWAMIGLLFLTLSLRRAAQ